MNLIDEAQSLQLYQFKDVPRFNALMRALIVPLQRVADDIDSLRSGCHIDETSDHRLDVLGSLVGQNRYRMCDTDYRLWLKVRIRLNRAQGTAENLLTILTILLGDDFRLRLDELPPRHAMLTFFDHQRVPLKPLFDIAREAMPITTKCLFVKAEHHTAFQFDTTAFSSTPAFAEFYQEPIHDE